MQVVATEASLHFFDPQALPVKVYRDEDDWGWSRKGDPVLHIDLRRWADIVVVAPLDANTLSKMANGLSDNLLACVIRAWDMTKPLIYCPAMNTCMWDHPLTSKHISILAEFGYIQVPPISKMLACGDQGFGAMAEPLTIVDTVLKYVD